MTYTIDTIEEAYDELEVDEGYMSFGAAVHNFYQNPKPFSRRKLPFK
ncbi:hypothetical protein [Solibacillus sp. FSL K6-4121]